MNAHQLAPGWYPSPTTPGQMQYWDGEKWLPHLAPMGAGGAPGTAFASGPPKSGGTAKWLIPVVACLALFVVIAGVGAVLAARGGNDDAKEVDGTPATTTGSGTSDDTPSTPGGSGTFTAGDYTFADVQVTKDFADDFAIRTRVTNDGATKGGVTWTVTILDGGSVVGTGTTSATDFEAGATITIEFISFDPYVDWDEVEFQVDSEY